MKNRLAKRIAASAMAIAVTVTTLMGNTAAYTLADTGSVEEAVQEEEIAEVAAVSDPEIAVESIAATVETEPAAEETAPEPEAVIVEETATIPEAEESEPAVVEEEETSGEGYEAGEYSETIDSGAEVIDESVSEATEDAEAAESTEAVEEDTEEVEDVVETSEEIEKPAVTIESEEAAEEIIEELDESTSAPILVGSIDAGLTSSLANVGGVTVNPGAYSPYFNSQTSGGVGAGTQQYTVSQNGKTYTAYCAEPEYVGVTVASARTAYEITDSSFSGWGANIKKVMYYTYGAPGGKGGNAVYDKLMAWVNADLVKQTNPPTTQDNLAYAYSHVIVAKAFNDMKNNIGYGGPNSLWAIGADGIFASAIGTVQDIVNTAYAQANVPAGFRVFLVPSTSEKSQSFMYWTYEPTGALQVVKHVTPKGNWANNAPEGATEKIFFGGNYSPNGAVYKVYSDAACTQEVASLTIGERNGFAEAVADGYYTAFSNVITLPVGTYFVKEVSCPNENLTLDTTVRQVTVTADNTTSSPARVTSTDNMEVAWFEIKKKSTDPAYKVSLEGAEFEIYRWKDGDNFTGYVGTIKTQADGKTTPVTVPIFTSLWAVETVAPDGYELAEPFEFNGLKKGWDNIKIVTLEEEPSGYPVVLQKSVAAGMEDIVRNNPCYDLTGTTYGLYMSEADAKAGTNEVDRLVVDTISDDRLTGTSKPVNVDIGTYYYKELAAGTGYGLNDEIKSIKVTTANTADKPAIIKAEDIPKTDPVVIEIHKVDAVTGEAVGGATLEGAQFEIRYYADYYTEDTLPAEAFRTWTVKAIKNEKTGQYRASLWLKNSVIGEISDELYEVYGGPTVPYGTVAVVETVPPTGYQLPENPVLMVRQINDNYIQEIASTGAVNEELTVGDEIVRGGLKFVKVSEDGKAMPGVPFVLTSVTTGESHVIVTDAAGKFSTEAAKHSSNTNANDAAYAGVKLDESKLDPAAGIWFEGKANADKLHTNDKYGALPYDTYTLTELRASTNRGKELISMTVKVEKNGTVVDLGNIEDPDAGADTVVSNTITGSQYALASNAEFEDLLTVSGIEKNITAITSAYDVTAGSYIRISGREHVETEIEAVNGGAQVAIPFTLDGSRLAGHKVAIETLIYMDGELYIEHNTEHDVDSEMIHFPKVITKAADKATKTKTVAAAKDAAVIDTVTYKEMPENQEVITVAEAVLKGATEAEDKVLATVKGKQTVSGDGTYTVEIPFDATAYGGRKVYVTERNYIVKEDGTEVLISQHVDRNDKAQTVTIPKIGTTLTDEETETHVALGREGMTLIDVVKYTGLEVGKTYEVKGTLYDQKTEKELVINGETITATGSFTAETEDGETEVVFTFDGSNLTGKRVVAFEEVRYNGLLVAVHADLNDENQIVPVPKIITKAADKATKTKTVAATKDAVVVDTVTYKEMPENQEVITVAEAVLKGATAAEDKILATVKGKQTVSGDGTYTVEIPFDATAYGGRKVYVTERNYIVKEDGTEVLISQHVDRNDKAQTVTIPKIGTTLTDEETETHVALGREGMTLIDVVKYTGLEVGKTYEVKGTLYDQKTEKELVVNGETITATASFTAETEDGEAEVVFTFDGSSLTGRRVVAFEEVRYNGLLVAVHADLNDENQIVPIPKVITKAADKATKTKTVAATKDAVVVDTVTYKEMPKDQEVITVAEAVLKGATAAEDKVLATVRGKQTVSGDGTYTVEIPFDATAYGGRKVYVTERNYIVKEDGTEVLISQHVDRDDTEQTVSIPKIGTKAVGGKTGTSEVAAEADCRIKDTVKYDGLTAGVTYEVKGTMIDKDTGEELVVNGKAVTVTGTFTAEAEDGKAEVTFVFDGRNLGGRTFVAFEEIYKDGILVAVHADINDADQTVTVISMGTTATDAGTGSKTLTLGENVKIRDSVVLKGLTVGNIYTLKGAMMDKGNGSDTGITGETSFKAISSEMSVDVIMTIDTNKYQNRSLVAFEELYDGNGILITEHKDLNDEGQTVTVPKIPNGYITVPPSSETKTAPPVKTGDTTNAVLYVLLAAAALAVITITIIRRNKSEKMGN